MGYEARPFKSELVVEEKISEATLRAYSIGFDQNRFRLKELVEILINVIPEYAFGFQTGSSFAITEIVDKVREAASLVYTSGNFKNRGEFGEVILHFLLRDFCNTIPLLSKIYFKDAINTTVKGFDGIHIEKDGGQKKLWLGESKIYKDGNAGIISLVKDIESHLKNDYLRTEFNLISRKIPENIPDREYWINLINKHQTLDKIFSCICVPAVCTYDSPLFINHSRESKEYLEDFKKECYKLSSNFQSKILTDVEVILMLLPIQSKDALIEELDTKLRRAQKI